MYPSPRVLLTDQDVAMMIESHDTRSKFSAQSASVNNRQPDAIQSAAAPTRIVHDAPVESCFQRAIQDLDHFSKQALKRKTSSTSSDSSDTSDSETSPVPKKTKIVVSKTMSAKTGSGKSKTESKDQGIEQRKEVVDLRKKLEEKTKELSMSRDCATRWERECRDQTKQVRKMRKEIEEINSLNSKFAIENNKLKSMASKNMLTIVEEEVKGQLDGMRNQWAKLGTPPKTADHGVDAGVQTEDNSTSKKRANLKWNLDNVVTSAMSWLQDVEIAKEKADTAQASLQHEMLQAFEYMKQLNEME